ncbi:uncharacterized protein TM35_000131370 [Trypanosoma theileri]|uniref:Uncharacterized protein n=1 Tax=Trypanosoma theileri TaxID=67003 RepID=A0A1X0NXD5_9TRYP|nr:uncharacterized protein TM35_000131370 [Trypanosoma theileri]ORC89133.1 hypothetical protein TM35_000131370 [Trypanosoma theileri]
MQRWRIHVTVAIAVFPLAALVAQGLAMCAQGIVEYIHGFAASAAKNGTLPSPLIAALLRVRQIDGKSLTMLDIQLVAILLFLCYASMLLLRHLVDISRLLKISRKRLFIK